MGQFDTVKFRTFDYDGFKDALFERASSDENFPNWTDTLESNQGVMFVEWLAFIGGNLCFMQNYQARQCFVPTATEAASMVKLAKQYAYPIPNNTASVVDLTITRADGANFLSNLVLPKGTQFLTKGSERLVFETIADLTIVAGDLSGLVAAKNIETQIQTDISDASPSLTIRASFGPYVEASAMVTVNSSAWLRVDNFLDSNSVAQHFTVEVESDGTASFIFGDGVNGQIPPVGATIEITYQVGGGTRGKIPPDTVTTVPFTPTDVNGNAVDIAVTNLGASEGGTDREDIEVSRYRIPASIASREVTVDADDFSFIIESIAGIARCKTLTVNDDPNIPENTVLSIILPEEADELSDALTLQIEAKIDENPTPLTQLHLLAGPRFKTIEMNIRDLEQLAQFDDSTGTFAEAIVTIESNTFADGDMIVVNGVQFEKTVDWTVGGDADATAIAIADAINQRATDGEAMLHDIEASALDNTVVLRARTIGVHGNEYTLTKVDTATANFTLSGAVFDGGEDSTVQLAIRAQFDAYFGRKNRDASGAYTSAFGKHVFHNDLVWQIRGVEIEGVLAVVAFKLFAPALDTPLNINQFPKYHLVFSTSREEDA